MSSELDLQSLVIKAVKEAGGFGFKTSHRFLGGIPDLFVKLPNTTSGLFEVKLNKKPVAATTTTVILDVTPLQERTLAEYEKAGGFGGIISFLQGPIEHYVAIFPYWVVAHEDLWIQKHRIDVRSHEVLPRGKREEVIVRLLERAHGRHCERISPERLGTREVE